MKKQKHKADRGNSSWSAGLLFALLFTLVPLFVENRYFNIVEAKAHMLSMVCFVGYLLIVITLMASRGKCFSGMAFSLMDIGAVAVGMSAAISCLLSQQPLEAFWGTQGWGIGGFILISLSVCYFFISRNLRLSRWILIPIYIVSLLILIVSIVHSMGIDFFHLHSDIYQPQFYYYKSTLGNINAHVGYICLLFPVTWLKFADAEKKSDIIASLTAVILILGEIVLSSCDGLFLGLGICAPFAITYICASAQRIRRTLLVLGVYGLWLCAAHMPLFAEDIAIADGIAGFILSLPVVAGILLLGWGGYALMRRIPKLFSTEKTRKILQWALLGMMAALIIGFFVHTVLNFSDDWGTGRALTWRVSLEYFATLNWRGKIFGIGPELLTQVYADKIFWAVPIYVAHSEVVQLLLSMGLFGVVAWVLLWAGIFAKCIRNKLWRKPEIIYLLSLMAYLGQSLVNSATGANIGMFCGMLACYRMAGCRNGGELCVLKKG